MMSMRLSLTTSVTVSMTVVCSPSWSVDRGELVGWETVELLRLELSRGVLLMMVCGWVLSGRTCIAAQKWEVAQ